MLANILLWLGTAYAFLSMLFWTDLSPIYYFEPTRRFANDLMNSLIRISPGLPFLWIISVIVVGTICTGVLTMRMEQRRVLGL